MRLEIFSIRNKNLFKPNDYFVAESLRYLIWETMNYYDIENISNYDSDGIVWYSTEVSGNKLRKIKDEYCDVVMLQQTLKKFIKVKDLFLEGSIEVFFDIIELFNDSLDEQFGVGFEKDVNKHFQDNNSAFRLVNGYIIKIDDIFLIKEKVEKGIDFLNSINMRDVSDMVKCALTALHEQNYNDCVKYSCKSTDLLKNKIIEEYSKKNQLVKSLEDIESFQKEFPYYNLFQLLEGFDITRNKTELENDKAYLNIIGFSKTDAEFCLNLSATINQFLFSIFIEDNKKGKIDYKIKPASEFDGSSSVPF